MISGNGLSLQTHTYIWDSQHSNRTDTIIISNATGAVVSKEIQSYTVFPWGTEMVQQQIDPDGANLTTTWSYYSNVPATNANYGHLQQVVEPSGRWTQYQYDQYGRTIKAVTQFEDSSLGSADNLNHVTTVTYTNAVPQETTVETVLGQETARRYRVFYPGQTLDIQCQTAGAAWNASNNLVTTTTTVPGGVFEGDVQSILNPDGTMSLYQYATNGTTSATITVYTGQPNSGGSAIVDGTKTVTTTDIAGNQISSATYDIVSGLVLSSNVTTATDSYGRPTTVVELDGTRQTDYGCCGILSTTDPEGITTGYSYDALRRTISTSRAGITISNGYDAASHVVSTVRFGTDNSVITLNSSAYDKAGRLTNSTDGVTNTTSYSEIIDGSGHTIKTTTYPDGSTRIETHYQDGQLLSVTGTAMHGVRYVYGVDGNGLYSQAIDLNINGSDSSQSTKTYSDPVARPYKTVYADGSSSQSYYNNQGQLVKQVDPDSVTTLFSYNVKGQQVVTAVDINQNGVIDTSGPDRITSNTTSVLTTSAGIVSRTATYLYSETGPVLASISDARNDGLESSTVSYGLTNQTVAVYNGNGSRTVTATNPDGSYTISQFQTDQVVSATQYANGGAQIGGTTYAYDPHGRLHTQTDARTGATTFTYDNDDRKTSASTSGQTTSYSYDGLGRQTRVTLPDNGTVSFAYYPTGELATNSGARTYPVAYTYDYGGRMKTLTTWQNYPSSGSATTTWNYDSLRGLLTSKVYNDSSSVTYSNSAAGRLLSRKWARGSTTSYAYNTAGDPGTITYSDSTPAVVSVYDRRGRKTSVTYGTNTCSYTYNDPGQVLTESFPSSGVVVTNTYDAFLRRSTLGFAGASVSYGYDNASRLQSVSNGTHTAAYSYLANSALVSNMVFATSGTTKMTTTKAYDNLNRLTSISSTPSSGTAISYAYGYNLANQRTNAVAADSSYWQYQYDSFGQVTSGQKYWSDGTAVAGEQFGYAFDNIGNRQTATVNANTGTYTANLLNQYTQRTVPGFVWELGNAASNATVTINLQPVTRKGLYFAGDLGVNNSSSAVYTQLVTVGVLKNAGTNNDDIQTITTGRLFVAQSPEAFTNDSDGNLTSDGRWSYSWDAENRLIAMQTLTNLPATVPQEKLLFGYDYMGRRISKVVSNFNGSAWSVVSNLKFVYDGWNLMAELNGTNGLVRSYMWGNDLSGSPQGAGGIGGLLAISNLQSPISTNFVAYDGNGNVTALIDASSGAASAQYEYGPFGELLRASGTAASVNPFRFSTKYSDAEAAMLCYGYRYYNPGTGRWLARDPIEEDGGPNLYAANENNSVDNIDPLGEDFIAAGSIPVDYVGAHMSLIFFPQDGPCYLQEGTRFTVAGVEDVFVGGNKVQGIKTPWSMTELVPNKKNYYQVAGTTKHNVWVSNLWFYNYYDGAATSFIVLYGDSSSTHDAASKWGALMSIAQSYPFGQYPVDQRPNPGRWPNSKYSVFGNNSNTYIRNLAEYLGRDADSIGGWHPGNEQPVPVTGAGPTPIWVNPN